MSKQQSKKQSARLPSAHADQKANQPKQSQDRPKNPSDLEDLEGVEEGGEESKHGRKQKGNVEDT